MKFPPYDYEASGDVFKGFRVWLSQVGKLGPHVKGGKNAVVRACPKCGMAFLPV
ncbi:MAG: hypothetical protein ACRECH_02590 [Nitrososphaerales archaeon]